MLTAVQNQKSVARVPGIWRYEMLNALGKGVARGRLERGKAFLFWRELQSLPIRVVEVAVDERLLELALKHNLAVYDACYLSLSVSAEGALALATVDGKLQEAAERAAIQVIRRWPLRIASVVQAAARIQRPLSRRRSSLGR